jgi:DNA-binding NarL/FixJ family response regulator
MPKSVLVVDDNPFIRKALCQLFTSEADFDVCCEAENGTDAIQKAQQLRPDVIVLDLSMPKMNGIDAARILKRMMPEVPLILFSEYGDLVSDAEARSAGISAVVPKSAHVSVLLATVRRHCGPIAA